MDATIPRSVSKTYMLGKTKVTIVAPDITEEERERRWKAFCEICQDIYDSLTDEELMEGEEC